MRAILMMNEPNGRQPRRDWLRGCAALFSSLVLFAGCWASETVPAAKSGSGRGRVTKEEDELLAFREKVKDLEREVGGRVGVFAFSPTRATALAYREDERFAMCSTFKWALAAAVIEEVEASRLKYEVLITYQEADLQEHAPFVKAHGPAGALRVEELCASIVTVSDNTAANLLLPLVGGPAGLTQKLRAWGDEVTRLDRREPELNSNLPADPRDTTTPRAMARLLSAVLEGSRLSPAGRERLLSWMEESTTGKDRLRAGFPEGVRAGDKTGTGPGGAVNDVAVFLLPSGEPWFVACYLDGSGESLEKLVDVHATLGRIVYEFAARGQRGV